MKKILILAAALGLAIPAFADGHSDAVLRLQRSTDVLRAVMSAPDKGIPQEVFETAKCIAVVPHMVKGGFIVGAKHGLGVTTCRTTRGWSAPAFVSVGGGSFGLQIGVQEVDLVMMVMNEKGMQHLLANKFQIGADASAAAGPVGRHASAGTDWTLNTEILTYSRAKGVFAGLTLEGAVVQQDDDSTRTIYGRQIPFKTILTGGVPTPVVARPFIAQVGASHYKAVRENQAAAKRR